jgi:hypothetical protein
MTDNVTVALARLTREEKVELLALLVERERRQAGRGANAVGEARPSIEEAMLIPEAHATRTVDPAGDLAADAAPDAAADAAASDTSAPECEGYAGKIVSEATEPLPPPPHRPHIEYRNLDAFTDRSGVRLPEESYVDP